MRLKIKTHSSLSGTQIYVGDLRRNAPDAITFVPYRDFSGILVFCYRLRPAIIILLSQIAAIVSKMTILQIQNQLRDVLAETARKNFGIELDQIVIETPPKTEFGDFAFPVAFDMAKRIKQAAGEKQNPRAIAEILKKAFENIALVDRVEVAV